MILNTKYKSLGELYATYNYDNFKIDLGCGYCKPSGFIGLDNMSGVDTQIQNTENAPDIIIDLSATEYPFPDDSCSEVRSSHFLEHSNIMYVCMESYRILKKNGIFMFAVPYANSAEGMYPGHCNFLTEKFFYKNEQFQKHFKIVKEEYFKSEDYEKSFLKFILPFSYARKFLFNACWQMILTCTPIK